MTPPDLGRARRILARTGAAYGTVGACLLYVVFTRFPRSPSSVAQELGALLLVVPATGALLGALAPNLGRVSLAAVTLAACVVGHVAFVGADLLLDLIVCMVGQSHACVGA